MLIKGGNDKVVKNIVKKVGAHPLGVDEINFFRDDNTILHFKNPEGNQVLIQLMLPSKTTPSSSADSQKLRPSRISSLISSNNWAPNKANFWKVWSLISLKVVRMCLTLLKTNPLQLPRTWTQ